MNIWTLVWACLGAVALFVEALALGNPAQDDTLTENVHILMRRGRIFRVILVLFWCWLGIHLFGKPGFL